ncbi:MAG: ATP-grasp domain-containing protein, partial [Kofleriaceae bacterium]
EWVPVDEESSPRFLSQLESLLAATEIDHIVPLTEATMYRLWDARPPWRDRVFPRTSTWQQSVLRDKHALIDHMAARGIAAPRQLRIDHDATTPDALIVELGVPLVIKEATGAGGRRVKIVESREQLTEVLARIAQIGGSWAAQEFIAGNTYLVGGVFHQGRPLRLYAAEKLEQYPPRVGPAVRVRSLGDADLLAVGRRVFAELGLTGFASADFMRRDDGSYVLLEVNPRPWGSIAAASSAGVDLFTPFCELLSGTVPVADLTFRAQDSCMIFPRYLLSSAYRTPSGIARVVRDLLGVQGREWRNPRFLIHILRRLRRVSPAPIPLAGWSASWSLE